MEKSDIKPNDGPTSAKDATGGDCGASACSEIHWAEELGWGDSPTKPPQPKQKEIRELLENMDAWSDHFRHSQHGATLTMIRARQTVRELAERVTWLEAQWEETKQLLHAVGSGKADSLIRRAAADALMHLETNYDVDGNSMAESDAADKLRSIFPNAEPSHGKNHQ